MTDREEPENQLRKARETIDELSEELNETNEGMVALTLELQKAEEKYRTLVETSPVGIYRTSLDGDIRYANQALADIFGFDTPEELMLSDAPSRYTDPRDRHRFIEHIHEHGTVKGFETRFLNADDEGFWAHISGTLRGDEVIGFIIDITEAKQKASALRRANTALRTLSRGNKELVHAEDEEALLQSICDIVVEEGGYPLAFAGYARHDPDNSVRIAAAAGDETAFLDGTDVTWSDDRTGRGPTGTAIRTGEPALLDDFLAEPDFAPWAADATGRGLASGLGLPLRHRGETYGALTIYARDTDAFGDAEVRLYTELANDLAYGIHTLRVRREKEAAVQELREKEKKYRHLFENLTDAAFLVSLDTGRIVEANRRAEELTGYAADELEGLRPTDLHPPDEEERYEHLFTRSAETGGVEALEAEAYTRNGDRVPVSITSTTIELEDERYVLGLLRDTTERKRAEDQLRKSEERFRALTETSPDCIKLFDLDGNIEYINRAGLREHSLTDLEEARDWDFVTSVQEQDRSALRDALDRARNGESTTLEVRHTRQGSTRDWCLETIAPVTDEEDRVVSIFGVSRDITPVKEAEKKIREREERYSSLVESTSDAVISIDRDRRIVLWNHAAEDTFGHGRDEALGMKLDRLIPPDKADVLTENLRRLEHDGDAILIGVDRTVHMLTKTGDEVPVEVSLSTYVVEGERLYTGIVRDISQRLERQRRIRRQAEELGVLDRLLRHNLRNELNVIIGHAELLEERLDDPDSHDHIEKILDTGTTLLDRNDKARRIRDAYGEGDSAEDRIDLSAETRDAVETARDRFPAADIRIDLPETLEARGDRVYRYALVELIENAVDHSDQDHPSLHITVRPSSDGTAEVRVADDGPGIPVDEIRPLMEGEETALNHASGIGLWLVKWFTEVQDGTLRFDENDPRGTVVTLTLPR